MSDYSTSCLEWLLSLQLSLLVNPWEDWYNKVEPLYKEALGIYEKLSINADSSIDNTSDDSNGLKYYKVIAIISIHLANLYRDKKKDEKY